MSYPKIEAVDFGSNDIYIFFSFFSFCECVCVYASLCDFCLYSFAFTICPRVLSVRFCFFVLFCFKYSF